MRINAEFDQRVIVHSKHMPWVDSPMAGVSRRPLDRVGSEVARATSIVKYQPGSIFSPHVHTGGEEFIVLEGVFQDEHGDFPTGSYIRNPPQSSHTPGSKDGCIIFVKLWQFEPDDRVQVRLDINKLQPLSDSELTGISKTPLHKNDFEEVFILNVDADAELQLSTDVLVLDGELVESSDRLSQHSWLRVPVGGKLSARSGADGAKVWVKQGHLTRVEQQIARVSEHDTA